MIGTISTIVGNCFLLNQARLGHLWQMLTCSQGALQLSVNTGTGSFLHDRCCNYLWSSVFQGVAAGNLNLAVAGFTMRCGLFLFGSLSRDLKSVVRECRLTRVLVIGFCCKVAVILLALCAVKFSMFCSNDCFSADYAVYSLEGVVCSGWFRIHNSKVVGSSPTPATNKINNLEHSLFWAWEFQPQRHSLTVALTAI